MRFGLSNLIWGTFLLLAAALILFNQIGGFASIGVGSIILAVLSLAMIVQCLAHLRIATLPIPLAVLYIIFQTPLELPYIKIWALILAAVLASMGLGVLLPKRHRRSRDHKNKRHGQINDPHKYIRTEIGNNDNNPSVSVNFGAVSRRLSADSLETVRLSCNFGSLNVFFDQAELSPNGAEVILSCSFGSVELFVPKHWSVIDKLNCTLGEAAIDNDFAAPTGNTPRLTLVGSVSLGGVDVRCM
jgi:predicted membrane protein